MAIQRYDAQAPTHTKRGGIEPSDTGGWVLVHSVRHRLLAIMASPDPAAGVKTLLEELSDYVTFAHKADPGGERFMQHKDEPLPGWAVDVRPEVRA